MRRTALNSKLGTMDERRSIVDLVTQLQSGIASKNCM